MAKVESAKPVSARGCRLRLWRTDVPAVLSGKWEWGTTGKKKDMRKIWSSFGARLRGRWKRESAESHLRGPAFWIAAMGALIASVISVLRQDDQMITEGVIYLASGAVFGSHAWRPEERDASCFPTCQPPAARGKLLMRRLSSLLTCVIGIGLLAVLVTACACGFSLLQNRVSAGLSFAVSKLLLAVLFMISSALLGVLYSLFHRLKILAIVLACLTSGAWGSLAARAWLEKCLWGQIAIFPLGLFSWVFAVAAGLPIAVLWLACMHSPLLEAPGSRRGGALAVVFLLLLLWGSAAISGSPADLWRIIASQ